MRINYTDNSKDMIMNKYKLWLKDEAPFRDASYKCAYIDIMRLIEFNSKFKIFDILQSIYY